MDKKRTKRQVCYNGLMIDKDIEYALNKTKWDKCYHPIWRDRVVVEVCLKTATQAVNWVVRSLELNHTRMLRARGLL